MTKKRTTKQTIKKVAKNIGFTKFDVFNMGVPEKIRENVDLRNVRTPFIPFGDDNLFPQFLAEIKRQSPTHRAILGQKKILSIGKQFHSENDNVQRFIDDVNQGESMREVYGRLMDDYYSFGNAFLQIVKYDGGINLYHIDATKCRISKNQKHVYIHPNWEKYGISKEDTVIVPIYPKFEKNTAIIHFKDYEPTFNYYGLPDFVGALEGWLQIDWELQNYNHSKFKNNFTPSAIVEINGDMGEEEAEQLVKDAQTRWTGKGNNSKILFLVKNGDTSPANVTVLSDTADGSFMDLQKLTSQNIITAHRWQPAMSGIVSSGKLSSTGNEIRVAWEMVMGTVIKDVEELLFNKIKQVIKETTTLDIDDFQIIYEPPVSYVSDIVPNQILTINEQREMLGFEATEFGDRMLGKNEKTE
jgi:capsid portal protein